MNTSKQFLAEIQQHAEVSEFGKNHPQKQKLVALTRELRQYMKLSTHGPWVARRVSAFEKTLNSLHRTITASELNSAPDILVCSICLLSISSSFAAILEPVGGENMRESWTIVGTDSSNCTVPLV
ncbi:hypothetical protein Ciccas_000429 [Cichlidogyrus casuarinus]|uniref:Uncharacterized protein n=1 Tax=Cichlidogyrus casuarinus TaxID=1844966 RepID=A0ABD2QMY8_9PLAT